MQLWEDGSRAMPLNEPGEGLQRTDLSQELHTRARRDRSSHELDERTIEKTLVPVRGLSSRLGREAIKVPKKLA